MNAIIVSIFNQRWKGTLQGILRPSWWLSAGPVLSCFREVKVKNIQRDYISDCSRQGDTWMLKSLKQTILATSRPFSYNPSRIKRWATDSMRKGDSWDGCYPDIANPDVMAAMNASFRHFSCLTFQGVSEHFSCLNPSSIFSFLSPLSLSLISLPTPHKGDKEKSLGSAIDWMFVSSLSKMYMLKPNPQCVGIKK